MRCSRYGTVSPLRAMSRSKRLAIPIACSLRSGRLRPSSTTVDSPSGCSIRTETMPSSPSLRCARSEQLRQPRCVSGSSASFQAALSNRDARQAQLDAAIAALGKEAFEDACVLLEKEFYALEDDLRDRLLAFSQGPGSESRDTTSLIAAWWRRSSAGSVRIAEFKPHGAPSIQCCCRSPAWVGLSHGNSRATG